MHGARVGAIGFGYVLEKVAGDLRAHWTREEMDNRAFDSDAPVLGC
jgi:hypothetical protein